MTIRAIDTSTCYLCGGAIDGNTSSPEDALSMDHVPPKQFYPKNLRTDRSPNLWLAPTHKRCNEDYRKDEEYFYHAMYSIVGKNNQDMGQQILEDSGPVLAPQDRLDRGPRRTMWRTLRS